MSPEKVEDTLAAVQRFLDCCRAYQEKRPEFGWVGTRESGALRRASMDLTRALADLRRPA